jgi:hypothetical protein
VEMLCELMAGREPARSAVVIPPRLVERGSCAAPRIRADDPAQKPRSEEAAEKARSDDLASRIREKTPR